MHSVYQEARNSTLIQLQKMRHRGSLILSLLLLKLLHFVLNVFAKIPCSYLPYHSSKTVRIHLSFKKDISSLLSLETGRSW